MEGYPLQIITKNEKTKSFELNEEALASVLLSDEVADKHVSVLAVAGAFRKGKSFLLNFFLQYCAHKGWQSSNDWLGDKTCPLQGFKWSRSHQRETSGILIWSKPFIMKTPSGEQVNILRVRMMVSSMRQSRDVSMGRELRAYRSVRAHGAKRETARIHGRVSNPRSFCPKQRPDTKHRPQTTRPRWLY
ncbi:Guanylate-binding protein N-terminal [Trinorchestia longiramus]|nr:Guanylate-binding protein N-terminal [Trinorchestia longiramus]